MTVSINCNRERRRSRDTSFPTVSQAVLNLLKADPFDSGSLTGIFERLIANDIYYDVRKMKDMSVANYSVMKC